MKKTILILTGAMCCSLCAANAEVFSLGTPGMPVAILKDERLQKALDLKPDLTVLLIGTNDMINSALLTPLPVFKENYERVVRHLLDSGSRVVAVTIPPCNEELLYKRHQPEKFGSMSPDSRIAEANKIIKNIAKQNKIPLADFHAEVIKKGTSGKDSLIRNPDNHGGPDGVHPTPEGYQKLAEMVFQIIKTNKIDVRRIVCLGDSITYGANVKGAGTVGGDTYPGQLLLLLNEPSK